MESFAAHLASIKFAPLSSPVQSELSPNRPTISDSDIDATSFAIIASRCKEFRKVFGASAANLRQHRIYLVDGFLMMQDDRILDELDFVIFLHSNYETLKSRRDSRFAYVTLEGTWQDPPNYFSKIVYPAYTEYNARVLCKLTEDLPVQTISIERSHSARGLLKVVAINSGLLGISDMVSKSCHFVVDEVSAQILK
ncbi:ribosylnicotinamide kinase [Physocladia obscura]|uniref:Ribosylnicotinamide kinase n=1 Tax=Physocladia obscura TaxID=109957 RepID=A0AAD5XG57_9FUNG|nr:ribosylnicotinamide kinase [Physocladia obscura]